MNKARLKEIIREEIANIMINESLSAKEVLILAKIATVKEKLTSHEQKAYLTSLAKDLKGSGKKKYQNFDLDDWSEDIEAYISERGL